MCVDKCEKIFDLETHTNEYGYVTPSLTLAPSPSLTFSSHRFNENNDIYNYTKGCISLHHNWSSFIHSNCSFADDDRARVCERARALVSLCVLCFCRHLLLFMFDHCLWVVFAHHYCIIIASWLTGWLTDRLWLTGCYCLRYKILFIYSHFYFVNLTISIKSLLFGQLNCVVKLFAIRI